MKRKYKQIYFYILHPIDRLVDPRPLSEISSSRGLSTVRGEYWYTADTQIKQNKLYL